VAAALGQQRVPRWKRVVDVGLVLLLLLPVAAGVGLLVAGWIRLVSRGGVLFRQTRVGRGGERFTMYKFRSMSAGVETATHEVYVRELMRHNRGLAKLDLIGDRRLIIGGRWLRMAGLDELPQLINVLRGEMSLVGPRPCLPSEAGFYPCASCRRFELLPGMTGLWQVERSEATTFSEMLEMDERYRREMSLALDLWILGRTPVALVSQLAGCLRAPGSEAPNER
jgi:lipopolysaccharide/colanic/teichoic acid biosynthesis glycosyltransferase